MSDNTTRINSIAQPVDRIVEAHRVLPGLLEDARGLDCTASIQISLAALIGNDEFKQLGAFPLHLARLGQDREMGMVICEAAGQIMMANGAFLDLLHLKRQPDQLEIPDSLALHLLDEKLDESQERIGMWPWVDFLSDPTAPQFKLQRYATKYSERGKQVSKIVQFLMVPLADGSANQGVISFLTDATEEVELERRLADIHQQLVNRLNELEEPVRQLERMLVRIKELPQALTPGSASAHEDEDQQQEYAPEQAQEQEQEPEQESEQEREQEQAQDVDNQLEQDQAQEQDQEQEDDHQTNQETELKQDLEQEQELEPELEPEQAINQDFEPAQDQDQQSQQDLDDDSPFAFDVTDEITALQRSLDSINEQADVSLTILEEPLKLPRTATNRCLVVDDIPVNQKLLVLQLKRFGYTPDLAANGFEALEAIKANDYDVVFMDLDMPLMNGFDAVRELRKRESQHPRYQDWHLPVIGMVAYDRDGDRQSCLDAGMDDCLVKGVAANKLKQLLDDLSHIDQEHDHDLSGADAQMADGAHASDIDAGHDESSHDRNDGQNSDKSELLEAGMKAQLGGGPVEENILVRAFISSMDDLVQNLQRQVDNRERDRISHLKDNVGHGLNSLKLTNLDKVLDEIITLSDRGDWPQVRLKYLKLKTLYMKAQSDLKKSHPRAFGEMAGQQHQ
ncbi:MAG: response regulator [Candidatus Melainabacteria bacterium]|jgi:CheY-like chemotaxis protein|nr:response regulator [Candidatus Melainabacteria bacterium]